MSSCRDCKRNDNGCTYVDNTIEDATKMGANITEAARLIILKLVHEQSDSALIKFIGSKWDMAKDTTDIKQILLHVAMYGICPFRIGRTTLKSIICDLIFEKPNNKEADNANN